MTGDIKKKIIEILKLQSIVVIYTGSTILSRISRRFDVFSKEFILLLLVDLLVLGIYALLWQQIIKKMDLSVAYINRTTSLCWTMLWAALLFHEDIRWNSMIGVLLILLGIIVINSDRSDTAHNLMNDERETNE